jgi:hypothetical protein
MSSQPVVRALAKIFTVTRDEAELIEDFILYYGHIFGFENLVIIDNNSRDERVLRIYDDYIPKGVTVVREPDYTGYGQGIAFTKHMRTLRSSCEFLIGADTDEFIIMSNDERLDSQCMRDYLRELLDTPYNMFKISYYHNSIPDPESPHYRRQTTQRPARHITTFTTEETVFGLPCVVGNSHAKTFYRASNFIKTENGNHGGVVSGNAVPHYVNLGYLHFNNTGHRDLITKARLVMDGYGYINIMLPVEEQISLLLCRWTGIRNGWHRRDQYMRHLIRRMVMALYVRHVGHLPTIDELEDITIRFFRSSVDQITSYIESLPVSPRTDTGELAFSDLLYHDPKIEPDRTFMSRYVSDYFTDNPE